MEQISGIAFHFSYLPSISFFFFFDSLGVSFANICHFEQSDTSMRFAFAIHLVTLSQHKYQWAATHSGISKAIWQLRSHSDWMVWNRWVTPFSCTDLEKLHLESCLCCLFIRRKQTMWRGFWESNIKWLKGWRETVGHVRKHENWMCIVYVSNIKGEGMMIYKV